MKIANRFVRREYTRRDFLKAGSSALLGAYALSLAGCGSDSESGSASGELSFLVWAGTAEEKGFRSIIKAYEKKNPKTKINLQVKPYDNYQTLTTRMAAGNAPDLARIQYQFMGKFSSEGALVDLSDYLPDGYSEDFNPAIWQSITYEGKPYAIPQHTDTMAIFYNVNMFDKLGIQVPKSPEEGWSWDEFIQISKQIKDSGVADYPFSMAWQNSAYRWMWFLFQHGGQLMTDDLKGPMINAPTGVETIAWNQSWFQENLVPPSTSIKSNEQVESLFANKTTAMMLNGDWLIPYLKDNMKDPWDVTYMIRDSQMASDLGGNAIAATKGTKNPELAADFLKFLASPEQMKQFCIEAQFIPVRKKLVQQGLDYTLRPEAMDVFVKQSATIPQKMAQEQAIPEFNAINEVLGDQLEAAFKTGQSAEATAKNISDGIEKELS